MEILVKRSARRRKTIQARMVGGKMEVLAPASISDAALQGHIEKLRSRLENRVYPKDDSHLHERANILNQRYFQGSLAWNSIQYSTRQERQAWIMQLRRQDHSHKRQAGQAPPMGGGLCNCA